MAEICAALPALEKKVLTSATRDTDIPDFVGIHDPLILDHTDAGRSWLEVRIDRAAGSDSDPDGEPVGGPFDPRRVAVRGYGPRWVG